MLIRRFVDYARVPPPRGIVHVGAHVGQEIVEYASYDPALVVWIEADPRKFEELKAHQAQLALCPGRQVLCNALVSDTDGEEIAFRIAAGDGEASSMFAATDLMRTELFQEGVQTGEVLQLRTRRLDGVLGENGVMPGDIDCLIVDTQGAELKCLSGAGRYLDNVRWLVCEASTIELYQGGAQLGELDAFLAGKSFVRLTPDPPAGHGDVLYIRIRTNEDDVPDRASDAELRRRVNGMIGQFNDGARESLQPLLDDVITDFAPILSNRRSLDIAGVLLRLTYTEPLSSSFVRLLTMLGWPDASTPR